MKCQVTFSAGQNWHSNFKHSESLPGRHQSILPKEGKNVVRVIQWCMPSVVYLWPFGRILPWLMLRTGLHVPENSSTLLFTLPAWSYQPPPCALQTTAVISCLWLLLEPDLPRTVLKEAVKEESLENTRKAKPKCVYILAAVYKYRKDSSID